MGFLASFLAGLFAAFAFGTFWFWTAAAVVAIVITALVENEEGAWATFVFLASLVGLNWLSRAGVGRFLVLHPWRVLAYVVVYFVAGAVWSLAKWYFYVRRQSAKYEEYKAAFLRSEKAAEMTPELAFKLRQQLSNSYSGPKAEAPLPAEHRGDLLRWATYWPFSLVGTLLNDVVREAWRAIYDRLQVVYTRISNFVFRHASADLALAKQYEEQQKAARPQGPLLPR